jgi:hypothetical protein
MILTSQSDGIPNQLFGINIHCFIFFSSVLLQQLKRYFPKRKFKFSRMEREFITSKPPKFTLWNKLFLAVYLYYKRPQGMRGLINYSAWSTITCDINSGPRSMVASFAISYRHFTRFQPSTIRS